MEFSRGQNFITHKVEPDDFRCGTGNAIAEMAMDGVFHHRAQFFEGFSLRDNAMPKRGGHVAAINLILLDFKDNFAHGKSLPGQRPASKGDC